MTTMEGRTGDIPHISQWLFSSMCALVLVGFLTALFFIVFNFMYRNYRFVKMSSPNINLIIIIGTIMIYSSVVLFGIDQSAIDDQEILDILCKVRPCLLSVGFTLVYGSMCTKMWRVYRIFRHSKNKRTVIKDRRLVCVIVGMTVVDAIILFLWLFFDPPQWTEQTGPTMDFHLNYSTITIFTCSSERSDMWVAIVCLYKTIILLYGTHLAWATRNVALIAMNDSACIIICVYTCVILVSLSAILSSMVLWIPDAWYACVGLIMWICPTEVLLLQHIPKFRAWKHSPDGNFPLSRFLTTSYLATNGNRSFLELEDELFLLSAENASLKRALNEKEELILALKTHVGSATDKLNQFILEADPAKHDSGCDVDGSSSATSQEDRENCQTDTKKRSNGEVAVHRSGDRNFSEGAVTLQPARHLLQINAEDLARQEKKRGRHHLRHSLRSANSLGSEVSVKSISELKSSLAEDLACAQTLSSDLYKAISKDLEDCRTKPMYYEIAKTEEALADVITRTYHINPVFDADKHSMASSDYTFDNPVFSRGEDDGKHRLNANVKTRDRSPSDGQLSRRSSFRSVASLALETAERRERSLSEDPMDMQYAQYTSPEDKSARKGSPSKTVRSADAAPAARYKHGHLNTYV